MSTIECPKCCGAKNFASFRHVVGGICFLCAGAGTVCERAADRWLAGQMGGSQVVHAAAPTADARPSKTVQLVGLSVANIEDRAVLQEGGTVSAQISKSEAPFFVAQFASYSVFFTVKNKTVRIDRSTIQNGVKGFEAIIERALTACVK